MKLKILLLIITIFSASLVLAYPLPLSTQSLETYPEPFLVNGVGNKIALVIGDSAGLDTIAITDIALGLGEEVLSTQRSTIPSVSLSREINDLTNFNAILAGGPCVNKHTADLMNLPYPSCGINSGIVKNTARIEIKKNGNNYALIVAGYDLEDTRRAGLLMKNFRDFSDKFEGKSKVVVTGKSLKLEDIKVE